MNFPVKNIRQGWDTDFHVHTRWSLDIPNGPYPEDYLSIAESNKIHIGFLDHYEIFYLKNLECPFKEKKFQPVWPFEGEKWQKYLDEMDQIKSNYSFVSSGLEIDYYPDMEDELRNFVDDYGNEFDLLVGSMHETEHFRPVTLDEDLLELIKKHGSFEEVERVYFELLEKMIKTRIFKAIAHPDTIYRFCKSVIPFKNSYDSSEYTKKIIDLCIQNDIWVEYNLSGIRHPVGRPFPPENIITESIKRGAKVYVGSDSHSVSFFESFIPEIRKANKLIKSP